MTAPYYADEDVTLHLGDCLDVLAAMEAGSVDAVVTDPPYGLEFMGREWDTFGAGISAVADTGLVGRQSSTPFAGGGNRVRYGAPGHTFQAWCEAWAAECLRVLKPGGHLLAFGGTRTWHRLVCGIEDAGFEVRDAVADLTGYDAAGLMWVYGSGFPKSLDVSKAIDKAGGNPLAFREFARAYATAVEASPLTHSDIDRRLGIKSSSCYWAREDYRGGMPPRHHWNQVRLLLGLPDHFERLYEAAEREIIGSGKSGAAAVAYVRDAAGEYDVTAPATEDAARWEGWGTALKPGWEPIAAGRKPLGGTVAGNVLAYGTGALNIDGCRVGVQDRDLAEMQGRSGKRTAGDLFVSRGDGESWEPDIQGRWPPNVVLGPAAAAELDRQSGTLTSGALKPYAEQHQNASSYQMHRDKTYVKDADTGGASRYFPVFRYEAKAPASERPRSEDGTAHPTVKPVDLMRWLVRLVTPPGGLVLDLFAGSGTTAEACIVEGFRCVLAEKDPASAELIVARLRKPIQPVMFGLEGA